MSARLRRNPSRNSSETKAAQRCGRAPDRAGSARRAWARRRPPPSATRPPRDCRRRCRRRPRPCPATRRARRRSREPSGRPRRHRPRLRETDARARGGSRPRGRACRRRGRCGGTGRRGRRGRRARSRRRGSRRAAAADRSRPAHNGARRWLPSPPSMAMSADGADRDRPAGDGRRVAAEIPPRDLRGQRRDRRAAPEVAKGEQELHLRMQHQPRRRPPAAGARGVAEARPAERTTAALPGIRGADARSDGCGRRGDGCIAGMPAGRCRGRQMPCILRGDLVAGRPLMNGFADSTLTMHQG